MKHLLALLFCTVNVLAGSTGGPYSITSDGLSAAGGRSSSATYEDDTSAGGTGTGNTSSKDYDAASGQSATLRDAIGLIAGPLTIPEGTNTQLVLYQLLDDSTLLTASSVGAVWTRISGSFTLTSGGLASTQAVASNQTAQVQVVINSSTISGSITIEDSIPDNFGNYAADGIGDDWQVQHFGSNNTNAAPQQDPDGDGLTNLFEFTAGLIPTSGASRFSVSLEDVPGQPGMKRLAFQPAMSGRTFTLLKSTTLAPGSWQIVPGGTASGNNGMLMLTDPAAAGNRAFYQVQISFP